MKVKQNISKYDIYGLCNDLEALYYEAEYRSKDYLAAAINSLSNRFHYDDTASFDSINKEDYKYIWLRLNCMAKDIEYVYCYMENVSQWNTQV